ncbi:glycoside hydrolase family 16 protein [Phenylobacterium sp.]|jgi:hypothetical protein|uniref:glycoside hydrolase family 16 protein n=1 Tax=Phenylobacterium sp. TaxID=1871053 RepID=UPI002F3E8E59
MTARRPGAARAALAAAVVFLSLATGGCGATQSHAETAPTGTPLDLSGYEISFEEGFSTLSIGDRPGSGMRWYNHTPWNGDFGDAGFAAPGPDGPFSRGAKGMNITARRGADGRWSSGLISSRDRDGPEGRGFVQQYGYFEIDAKLPSGMGVWPAFWLIGVDKSESSAEIDVMEYYGGFPRYYHCVAHIWRGGKDVLSRDFLIRVQDNLLTDQFNKFGVLIEPETTTFYLNHRVVGAMETPPEYRQPFYILANLAIGGGWPIEKLTTPKTMEIARIRVYRRIAAATPEPAAAAPAEATGAATGPAGAPR